MRMYIVEHHHTRGDLRLGYVVGRGRGYVPQKNARVKHKCTLEFSACTAEVGGGF